MSKARSFTCDIPLNRVEGDLSVRVAIESGAIAEAWSAGTLYRGFENLLNDRAPLDALMITPRICGICTTTHLYAAARCLDDLAGVTPPDNAVRLRNIALLVEHVQSDLRQTVLMYMVDFINPAYSGRSWFNAARGRYEPLAGSAAVEVLRATRRLIEIIAVIGGQWPHSSFMVPGGVTQMPTRAELTGCRQLIQRIAKWYEQRVLGGSIEEWQSVDSLDALESWIGESERCDSELVWLMRLGRDCGLDGIGAGCGRYLSYGLAELPIETRLRQASESHLQTPGIFSEQAAADFDPTLIGESIAASHFRGYEGLRHPREGVTRPINPDSDPDRYSWAKAPRYDGQPAETGPLAEALVAGDALFRDWVDRQGASALARQAARLIRPARLLPVIDCWLEECLAHHDKAFIVNTKDILEGEGAGLITAARGGLGHWARVEQGRITGYQIITPTTWNGSPRDDRGTPGPWESALEGTPVADPDNPVEAGHVIRSFDPCLVCTVHAFNIGSDPGGRLRLGGP